MTTGSATIAAAAAAAAAPAADPAAAAAAAAAAPPAFDAAAWAATRATLAGGNQDRAQALESFADPDALFARITAPEPVDWRKAMAGDDVDELKALERYADPAAARKAWKAATAEISAGGRVKIPGADATPEEIAAYNKALGVPEKADGYTITATAPEGYEISEADKGFLGTMTARLHDAISKGAKPNDIVNLAHQLYLDTAADAVINAENAAADAAVAGEAENKKLWGAQYPENVRLAITGARHFFPGTDDQFEQFMGLKLETGHALFDHPMTQRMFAQIAREAGAVVQDPFFLAAKAGNKGFDPVKRKNEILKMREGSSAERAEYARLSAPGGELSQLVTAMTRQSSQAR